MAKVKIQGHASGTGILTVTAPDTDENRTITLPDATGTLLNSDGSAASLTAIPAANITGTLPAIDGSSLTGIAGRKNMIINGGFDVWQRGTTGTAQGYNSADRWYIARGGGSPAVSITRETFATTETDIKSKYYLQWVQSTGGTNPYIVQRVEEVKPFLGQEVTVSVWMKAASAVTIDLDVYIDYGDAQSTTLDENTSFSVTTSWQKFQHTFTISSGGTVAANSNLEVRFSPPDSNTITTYFAEAQLEYGSTATDFEHRSYGEELALCQRYYCQYASNAASGADDAFTNVVFWGGYWAGYIYFPCTMRVAPTFTASAVDTFNLHQAGVFLREPSTMLIQSGNIFGARIHGAMTYTETNGLAGQLCADGTDTCYLNFDSEL